MKNGLVPALIVALSTLLPHAAAKRTNIPYADAEPILNGLREDLRPVEFRGKTPAEMARDWPAWVTARDRAIRARLALGDEQSVINFLLYGTSFTKQPRTTDRELARRAASRSGIIEGRIADLAAGVVSPGTNERLQFVQAVLVRRGIDPSTAAGRDQVRRFLRDGLARLAEELRDVGKVRESLSADPAAAQLETATLFRNRGLASDTTFMPDFGLEQALAAIRAQKGLVPQSVRRIAVVGPGLDFTDKLDGFDFYPVQSIQPFAVVDSLRRLGLAAPAGVHVTTLDLSPTINRHLERARTRAAAGRPYELHVPLDVDLPWTPAVHAYWKQFGERIGTATIAAGPPEAGQVMVRRVQVRPDVVASVSPEDVNIVLQRLDPLAPGERFDLVIATDILLYYGVFEQSLAVTNIAAMLRPQGVFLTNNRVFELPMLPLASAGAADMVYLTFDPPASDRFVWFSRTR